MGQETSAGLLMYRRKAEGLALFLVHPGGPFYAKKDDGIWSIPKGLVEPGEALSRAAEREFEEETGIKPGGPLTPLGTVTLRSGKVVHAWAFQGDWDSAQGIRSNHFEMEWPPHSGRVASFPEADRAAFFSPADARRKILPAQTAFIDRLEAWLSTSKPGGPSGIATAAPDGAHRAVAP